MGKTVGIFIGRFMPLHKGHEEIIEKAKKEFDEVIVIIGSSDNTITLRNPFDIETRIKMFQHIEGINILTIENSNYDFEWWKQEINNIVNQWCENQDVESISLIGCKKYSDSYWLDHFPQWKFWNVGKLENDINATDIRDGYFTFCEDLKDYHSEFAGVVWREMVSDPVSEVMISWRITDEFKRLRKELRFIKEYKKSWEGSPFPPIFTTVDALVLHKDKILIIERGQNPGKGKLSLPGGFIGEYEYLLDAAIRELKEETNIECSENQLKQAFVKSKVFDDPYRDPRGRMITHVHLFDLNKICYDLTEINVKAGDDAGSAKWMTGEEIDENKKNFSGDQYRIICNMLNKIK